MQEWPFKIFLHSLTGLSSAPGSKHQSAFVQRVHPPTFGASFRNSKCFIFCASLIRTELSQEWSIFPHVTINMCGENKCAQNRQFFLNFIFQWQYTYHLFYVSLPHVTINNMWNTNGKWRTSFNFTNIQISKVCLKIIAPSSTELSPSPEKGHKFGQEFRGYPLPLDASELNLLLNPQSVLQHNWWYQIQHFGLKSIDCRAHVTIFLSLVWYALHTMHLESVLIVCNEYGFSNRGQRVWFQLVENYHQS